MRLSLFALLLCPLLALSHAQELLISPFEPAPEGTLQHLQKYATGVGAEFGTNAITSSKLKELGVRKLRCISVDVLPGKFTQEGDFIVDDTKPSRMKAHLDLCNATGAAPHIIVGVGLPPELLSDAKVAIEGEGMLGNINTNIKIGPTDWARFEKYYLALFEYVVITKGRKDAVFEAFNEPDINGYTFLPTAEKTTMGSKLVYENIYKLYKSIANAATAFEKKHNQKLVLGGPGLAWVYTFRFGDFNWGERFLRDTAREKVKLDFIGVHYYGNCSSLHGEYKLAYPSFEEMVGSLRKVRDEVNPTLPIRINEWGPSYLTNNSDASAVNANHMGAAWCAEFMTTMLKCGVDDALYLVTSDFHRRDKDGKFFDVWGWPALFVSPLAYPETFPKATYHLFAMINAMRGLRVPSNKAVSVNSFSSVDAANKTLYVLAWNYRAKIPEFQAAVEFGFEEEITLKVEKAAKLFQCKEVTISTTMISRDHGDIHSAFKRGETLTQAHATPKTGTTTATLNGADLTFKYTFPPSSVVLFEIKPSK